MDLMRPAPAPSPASGGLLGPRESARVIVYGRAGCPDCLEAVQELIDRQVCFTYHDIGRDERALSQLKAICGEAPMVPVIIQIGPRGG